MLRSCFAAHGVCTYSSTSDGPRRVSPFPVKKVTSISLLISLLLMLYDIGVCPFPSVIQLLNINIGRMSVADGQVITAVTTAAAADVAAVVELIEQ